MNSTIEEATVKRMHYHNHDQLRTHLPDFMASYNFARRVKTISSHGPHALRPHLQNLDIRAGQIHPKPDPPEAVTEQQALGTFDA